ncbi:MAG: S8 family peptidase, partial [Candidatus Marinimicrobia bacterium]|nr:S8 family peptidase [Candidatus Neomarinimicrobiota bacterium]
FDSLQVDIASASLAYLEFDPPYQSYPVSALDGSTTVVARICNWAASRGMIIVNAAGNEGPDPTTIWSPGDSPWVITVGGVDSYRNVSLFSGRGPTADGRIKPDVAALAEDVYKVLPSEQLSTGTGTSYATPLITSGIALVKQIHPEWNAEDMFYLFMKYASHPKNNDTGWGVPNFGKIIHDLYQRSLESFPLYAYPNPSSTSITIITPRIAPSQSLAVYDLLGRKMWETSMESFQDTLSFCVPIHQWPAGIYFGRTGGKTVKFIKQ